MKERKFSVVCVDNDDKHFRDEELYYKRIDGDMPLLDINSIYSVRYYTFNNDVGYVIDVGDRSWYYNTFRFKDLRIVREEKLNILGL